jgi:hypothetical protein
MQIKNRTCIPTNLLIPIIEYSANIAGANLENLTISINPNSNFTQGVAENSNYCKLQFPVTRKCWYIYEPGEFLNFARDVLGLIVHELKHISDYQNEYPDMHGCRPQDIANSEYRAVRCAEKIEAKAFNNKEILKLLTPLSEWAKKDMDKKFMENYLEIV